MATKLFVGGLSYAITSDQLEELFSGVGQVQSAQVIVDRETQRSKGFGFVEMSTEEEAQKAIAELNGKEVEGRAIAVNEARPQEKREPRSFGGGGGFRGSKLTLSPMTYHG
jgi:RNA recognition motif-containing protein